MENKAVFLDRDGTIAEDVSYCRRIEDFHILSTVPEAIRLLNQNGFKVVVITNQSGIARGYFTEERLTEIHHFMKMEILKSGGVVDAVYYCSHHPDDRCGCRKPGTELFIKAAEDLKIDLESSYMIGDRQMDIDAGKSAGCRTLLVTTGPNLEKGVSSYADHTAGSLIEAARWIIEDVRLPKSGVLTIASRTL